MDSAREAVARLRIQTLRGHRAAHVDEIPARALQQDGLRLGGNFAFQAAHHARDGQRAFRVAHQGGEGVQIALHPIQGGQLFAGVSRAGDDGGRLTVGALAQMVVIEGVQRLAGFQHDVIGGVHNAVDRPHARQAQTALHPIGAGARRRAAQHADHKARVHGGVLNLNGNLPHHAGPIRGQTALRQAQRFAGDGGQFAGHTQHAGVADHVGQDGNFEHGVAHVVRQGHARGRIVIQEDDALMLLRDAQFLLGTHHRVAFHAADLGALEGGQHLSRLVAVVNLRALFGVGHFDRPGQGPLAFVIVQIGRAGEHHLFLQAVIQAAQHQAVRVGVGHDLVNLRHHHLLAIPGQARIFKLMALAFRQGQAHHLHAVHLQAGHS